MSALTPEAARAAAAWLEKRDASVWLEGQRLGTGWWVRDLRAEADRLEAAAKTPGQVAYEAIGFSNWSICSDITRRSYERGAAAVIDHHVGPDRVVVDRAVALDVLVNGAVLTRSSKHLREALS